MVEWRRDQGVSHFLVDRAGTRPARYARTGILRPAKAEDLAELIALFEEADGALDATVRRVVREQLRSLAAGEEEPGSPGGAV